jgi:hypothetical protein
VSYFPLDKWKYWWFATCIIIIPTFCILPSIVGQLRLELHNAARAAKIDNRRICSLKIVTVTFLTVARFPPTRQCWPRGCNEPATADPWRSS